MTFADHRHYSLRRCADRSFLESLPLWHYDGKIVLLRDPAKAREALKKLLMEKVLGFDTETRPAFHRGQHYDPAIVQLAGGDAVYVFQLKWCGGVEVLFPLFEAERPLKVCLGVGDDVRHLRQVVDFAPAGFFELTQATRTLGIADNGLRKLCAILLGVRISKREQTSNWAKEILTEGQLRYAATDAWVSRRVYEVALDLQSRNIRAED
jgi:ribonuclease D